MTTGKPKRNLYMANLRDARFVLWEQLRVHETLGKLSTYAGLSRDVVDRTLDEAERFAYEVLGPEYQASDRESCTLGADGRVTLPSGYARLWDEYRKTWGRLGNPDEETGSMPYVAVQLLLELFMGANPSFMTYGGFCGPAVRLLDQHGSELQKRLFRAPLAASEWTACLCLTEAQAGSDLSQTETVGVRQDDGTYLVTGEKVYISAGFHDLTGNTVYFVIGRSASSPKGTLGLCCYVVPKRWVNADGSDGGDNHVRCVGLIDKMGFKGCANTHLTFGKTGATRAYLLGDKENVGLRQFLTLMNQARISTGVYALGMASSGYMNALAYSHKRIQGKRFLEAFNPTSPSHPIVEHADVQRMLLEMKSKTEGSRALIARLSYYESLAAHHRRVGEIAEAQRFEGLVSLMTPIVKAYVSDQSWRVCELAIQTHGGLGYTDRFPVEQYARDVKVLAIWEGTNFMQSQDLVRDKLAFGRGSKLFQLYVSELKTFIDMSKAHVAVSGEVEEVRSALAALERTLAVFAGWVAEKRMDLIPQYSTRFLELMAEVTLAWLLVDQARIASDALAALPEGHADQAFYRGKIAAAKFYVHNVLPGVHAKAAIIAGHDRTAFPMDASIHAL